MLKELSLEEKIGQMFMIGFDGVSLPEDISDFISSKNIGSVILFSRNIKSIADVINLNNEIHSLGTVTPMIWTDQEGGTIVRFGEMTATGISHMGIAETNNPENAKTIASIIAKDMKQLGIDGVFAPVLDVNTNENNPIIGIRAFSNKPDKVLLYGKKFIEGLNGEGIASCGKHFPGHGAASADSHLEIPKILLSKEDFNNLSIYPFLQLSASLDSLMTAHVKYPEISEEIGTFSKEFITLNLKQNAKFSGVVFSDCLEMKAIADNYTSEEIVFKSISAGIDIMIISHTKLLQEKYYNIALNLVKSGKISEKRIDDSVLRILKLKNKYKVNKFEYKRIRKYPILRKDIAIERKIAIDSIKVLRNRNNILPINKDSKCLFIECTNKITVPSVINEKKISQFESIIKKHFPLNTTVKLNLSYDLDINYKQATKNINDYDNVIVFIYSFNAKTKKNLITLIDKIYRKREDIIIISLENPYEINQLSFINTFICSYGFRQVQLEAVLKTLSSYKSK